MNILKINGTALTGIYVDAAVSFNKPAKRVETFSVPGRNGDLVIDEGTFDNVLISYPVYEKSTFPDEFDAIVNWLASLQGYQRIECSNDPQHYRLGRFVVPQTPTAKRLNKDGYYTLTFDCKPQRWLLSGEEDTEITANPSTEYTGGVVTFTANALDEITGLTADIDPIQNLNGQASPYPAGGGKNKFGGEYGTSAKYPVPSGATTVAISGKSAGTYALNIRFYDANNTSIATVGVASAGQTTFSTYASVPTNAATFILYSPNSGDTTTFSQVQVEAGSTATDYAPYSNICPISGFTGAEVYRTGENLFDASLATLGARLDTSGYTFSGANYYCTSYITVEVGKTYFKNSPTVDAYHRWWTYNANKTPIRKVDNSNTITIESGEAFVRFCGLKTEIDSAYCGINGTYATYPIPLGQTVYGGTLNVKTGVLTIDRAMEDLGDLSYTYRSAKACFDAVPPSAVKAVTAGNLSPLICSTYKTVNAVNYSSWQNTDDKSVFVSPAEGYIVVHDTGYTSKSDFTTAVTGQTLVYELATPTTVQLTPTEVTTLLGQNNIWADTGDVTVEVTSGTLFNNPSPFNAKPLIRAYGIGTFRINDNVVTIASHDKPYIDIDCELQECYYEGENMSAYVSFSDNDYPVLIPDDNFVLLASGITKLDVIPRWWIL